VSDERDTGFMSPEPERDLYEIFGYALLFASIAVIIALLFYW
jgi:hypothetical protein